MRGSADKVGAIGVEGAHIVADFVDGDVVGQTPVALRVQVVGPHKTLFLPCGHGKGAHAGCDVADCVPFLKDGAEPLVLGVQARVPVDFGKVELEGAALLVDLDVEVVFADEDFVLEGAEGVFAADVVEFVDDGFHHGILVGEDGGDEVLVGPVALAQVEVGDVAGQCEALGYLVVVLLLGRGDGCACNLRVGEVVVVEVQLVGDDTERAILLEVAQLRAPCGSICLRFRLSTLGCCVGQWAYRCARFLASRRDTCRLSALSRHPGLAEPAVCGCWEACLC